ncbi:amphi-Trp domain-containing protein [Natrialbaceae archaeon A-gly3]
MADRTQASETLTRSELTAYLRTLAEEFDSGDEEIGIDVGNKRVTLNPPEEVSCDVEVVERSSVLRGSKETVTIELSWKP